MKKLKYKFCGRGNVGGARKMYLESGLSPQVISEYLKGVKKKSRMEKLLDKAVEEENSRVEMLIAVSRYVNRCISPVTDEKEAKEKAIEEIKETKNIKEYENRIVEKDAQ